MGCDIHMHCEQLKTIEGDKQWVNVDHWVLNPYFGRWEGETEYECVELCGDRNYRMFAALCGVRDYTGESPKISEPKGLPNDCTELVKKSSESWGSDGHSHSYVTLREVKQFVKENRATKFAGLISQEQARQLDDYGITPNSWCQGSSDRTLVRREWEVDDYQPLENLYKLMAERCDSYRKPDEIDDEKLDKFRIVFWFDN